jgi:hypothetical protein
MLREIEQFYNTQVDEMPLNVADCETRFLVSVSPAAAADLTLSPQ